MWRNELHHTANEKGHVVAYVDTLDHSSSAGQPVPGAPQLPFAHRFREGAIRQPQTASRDQYGHDKPDRLRAIPSVIGHIGAVALILAALHGLEGVL